MADAEFRIQVNGMTGPGKAEFEPESFALKADDLPLSHRDGPGYGTNRARLPLNFLVSVQTFQTPNPLLLRNG